MIILSIRAAIVGLVFVLEVGVHTVVAWVVTQVHVGDKTVESIDTITSILVIGIYLMAAFNTLVHMADILVVRLVMETWRKSRQQ